MGIEYRVFFLTHGQMPPIGTTSIGLSGSGGIMWKGEEGDFPVTAKLGNKLFYDKEPKTTYKNRLAIETEINEYNKIISGVLGGGNDE